MVKKKVVNEGKNRNIIMFIETTTLLRDLLGFILCFFKVSRRQGVVKEKERRG